MDGFLAKPVSPAILRAEIERVTSKNSASQPPDLIPSR
jgi:hypothetical protein